MTPLTTESLDLDFNYDVAFVDGSRFDRRLVI